MDKRNLKSLEKIKKIRTEEERALELNCAKTKAERDKERAVKEQFIEHVKQYETDFIEKAKKGGCTAFDFTNYNTFKFGLKEGIKQQEAKIAEKETQLEEDRLKWREAHMQTEMVETLYSKQYMKYKQERAKLEQKETDEIAQQMHNSKLQELNRRREEDNQ